MLCAPAQVYLTPREIFYSSGQVLARFQIRAKRHLCKFGRKGIFATKTAKDSLPRWQHDLPAAFPFEGTRNYAALACSMLPRVVLTSAAGPSVSFGTPRGRHRTVGSLLDPLGFLLPELCYAVKPACYRTCLAPPRGGLLPRWRVTDLESQDSGLGHRPRGADQALAPGAGLPGLTAGPPRAAERPPAASAPHCS